MVAREGRGRREEPEADTRIIVRRELTPEEPSPPKKVRLEEEDAELLEMRRKALESLMKRTDKELVRREDSSDSSSSESEESSEESEVEEEQGAADKPEPTFVVTLDGLDNKFFNSKQKGALEAAREKAAPKVEPRTKKPTRVEKGRGEGRAGGSKASSDGELELHAEEEFEEAAPAKKSTKESERPMMAVAARKRSPILLTDKAAKQVAEVRPVVAAAAQPSAAKLAGSYAARLTAIKAAKAAQTQKSTEEQPTKPATKVNTSVPKIKPVVKAEPIKSAEARAKITAPSAPAAKPVVKQLSAPPRPAVARFKSAPVVAAASNEAVCRFWPSCKFRDACAFYHPPARAAVEAQWPARATVEAQWPAAAASAEAVLTTTAT